MGWYGRSREKINLIYISYMFLMTQQNYQNHKQSDRGRVTAFLILFIITIFALWSAGLDILYYIQEGVMESM